MELLLHKHLEKGCFFYCNVKLELQFEKTLVDTGEKLALAGNKIINYEYIE